MAGHAQNVEHDPDIGNVIKMILRQQPTHKSRQGRLHRLGLFPAIETSLHVCYQQRIFVDYSGYSVSVGGVESC